MSVPLSPKLLGNLREVDALVQTAMYNDVPLTLLVTESVLFGMIDGIVTLS